MKRLHFWTWAFIIVGIIVFVASTIWFGKYPNLSEYLMYVGGAIVLWMFAAFCEVLKRVIGRQEDLEKNQIRDLERNQKELQRWVTEQERKNESSE